MVINAHSRSVITQERQKAQNFVFGELKVDLRHLRLPSDILMGIGLMPESTSAVGERAGMGSIDFSVTFLDGESQAK